VRARDAMTHMCVVRDRTNETYLKQEMGELIESYMRAVGRWLAPPSYPNAYLTRYRLFPLKDIPEKHKQLYKGVDKSKVFITTYGSMVQALYVDRKVNFDIKLSPVERKRIEIPEEVYSEGETYKLDPLYAYELFATTTANCSYAFLLLYLEALHTGRTSRCSHRHMLRLSDLDTRMEYMRKKPYSIREIGFLRQKNHSMTMFSRHDARNRLLEAIYPLDVSKYSNVYITGSLLTYSFDMLANPEHYANSDVDVLVDRPDITHVAMNIAKDLNKPFHRVNLSKGRYKFVIKASRQIEIYNAPIGSIVGYHVPMVRAAFDGSEFIVTPSFLQSMLTRTMFEYRWVKCGNTVIDVIKKYVGRGFDFYGSPVEMQMIYGSTNKKPIKFDGVLYPGGKLKALFQHAIYAKLHRALIPPSIKINRCIPESAAGTYVGNFDCVQNISNYRLMLSVKSAYRSTNNGRIVLMPNEKFETNGFFGEIIGCKPVRHYPLLHDVDGYGFLREIPQEDCMVDSSYLESNLSSHLPLHIMDVICKYLSLNDLRRAMPTSKYYSEIFSQADNWRDDCPDKKRFDKLYASEKRTKQQIYNGISMSILGKWPIFSDYICFRPPEINIKLGKYSYDDYDETILIDGHLVMKISDIGIVVDKDGYSLYKYFDNNGNSIIQVGDEKSNIPIICKRNWKTCYVNKHIINHIGTGHYAYNGWNTDQILSDFSIKQEKPKNSRERRIRRYLKKNDLPFENDWDNKTKHIWDTELDFSDDGYSSGEDFFDYSDDESSDCSDDEFTNYPE
jgi:hypothetical protein